MQSNYKNDSEIYQLGYRMINHRIPKKLIASYINSQQLIEFHWGIFLISFPNNNLMNNNVHPNSDQIERPKETDQILSMICFLITFILLRLPSL